MFLVSVLGSSKHWQRRVQVSSGAHILFKDTVISCSIVEIPQCFNSVTLFSHMLYYVLRHFGL